MLTAVLWDCTPRRLASVVFSDVPNESSAFEMYQAVRCHPRRPESSCFPADRLRNRDLLNGDGAVLIGFGQGTDLLLFCCTAVVVPFCCLSQCSCTVVVLLLYTSAVELLYSCTAVLLYSTLVLLYCCTLILYCCTVVLLWYYCCTLVHM